VGRLRAYGNAINAEAARDLYRMRKGNRDMTQQHIDGVQTVSQPQHAPRCKSVSDCPDWDHCRAVGECCPPEPVAGSAGNDGVEGLKR
jgi:hypothetical protein